MKIKSIPLAVLRNEEHFQFVGDTLALLKSASQAGQAAAADILSQLEALHEREDRALEQIRKSGLTDPITELDARRDSFFRGLQLIIEAHSHSPNQGDAAMAANVQIVLGHYGNFTKKSYNEETAIIHNLLQDLSARCLSELQQLHAEPFFTALDSANREFEELMGQRYDANALQVSENVRDLRKEVDAVYQQLVATLNASVVLHGESNYADFIGKLNERIAYYNRTIAERRGRSAAKKKTEL